MSPCPTAHPWSVVAKFVRFVVFVALTFASVGCASSQPKTQVLGEQEQKTTSEGVVLLDAVCITNTPTREPC